MTLILASSSKSRRRILEAACVSFEVVVSDVDEEALRQAIAPVTMPTAMALKLAKAKAANVANRRPEALVIGADQTLLFEGELITKCADRVAAADLLRRLRAQTHSLFSALVLMRHETVIWQHQSRVDLTMRAFSEVFLQWYIDVEGDDVLDGVGCYRLEGVGSQLFSRIDGDYFSTLGLPLLPLLTELRNQGMIGT